MKVTLSITAIIGLSTVAAADNNRKLIPRGLISHPGPTINITIDNNGNLVPRRLISHPDPPINITLDSNSDSTPTPGRLISHPDSPITKRRGIEIDWDDFKRKIGWTDKFGHSGFVFAHDDSAYEDLLKAVMDRIAKSDPDAASHPPIKPIEDPAYVKEDFNVKRSPFGLSDIIKPGGIQAGSFGGPGSVRSGVIDDFGHPGVSIVHDDSKATEADQDSGVEQIGNSNPDAAEHPKIEAIPDPREPALEPIDGKVAVKFEA